MIFVFIWRSY